MGALTRSRGRWTAIALSLLLAGCGDAPPRRAAVEGSVTFNQRPLVIGTIVFQPALGVHGPKVGLPIRDGKFSADAVGGPMVGAHRVQIWSEAAEGMEDVRNPLAASAWVSIPDRYNASTELQATIAADQINRLDFALESPPAAAGSRE